MSCSCIDKLKKIYIYIYIKLTRLAGRIERNFHLVGKARGRKILKLSSEDSSNEVEVQVPF
jgi:hypothetical protein